ncbi:GyrI-like domain-containing protein [Bacillus cihuensis]|uniref:GyrI-like domain-containing protein n=1 Tax=Bacillus cihuensis TaxID=1208599 RepID=UPI00040C72E9|nr:GyrI-like domain-containing protein [Bacillus cihuensis]
MKTRIETIEGFWVIGYKHVGTTAEIPQIWDKLNATLKIDNISADTFYGVCIDFDREGKLHYLAGIQDLVDRSDVEKVKIESGRYIVATVENGIPGIKPAFQALHEKTDVQFRFAPNFEKYLYPASATDNVIEVWMPIK